MEDGQKEEKKVQEGRSHVRRIKLSCRTNGPNEPTIGILSKSCRDHRE